MNESNDGTCFIEYLRFPCQYHSANVAHSVTHLPVMLCR